jgi:hypothetical protein
MEQLESLTIDGTALPSDLAGALAQLIGSLGVVTNKAKLVAGTKTLHHLLPDLVPPMDRAWTGLFFQFHLPEWQDPRTFGHCTIPPVSAVTGPFRWCSFPASFTHAGLSN